jgi:hypothetical protein
MSIVKVPGKEVNLTVLTDDRLSNAPRCVQELMNEVQSIVQDRQPLATHYVAANCYTGERSIGIGIYFGEDTLCAHLVEVDYDFYQDVALSLTYRNANQSKPEDLAVRQLVPYVARQSLKTLGMQVVTWIDGDGVEDAGNGDQHPPTE